MNYSITKISKLGFELFEAKIVKGNTVIYVGTHYSHGGAKQSILSKLRSL